MHLRVIGFRVSDAIVSGTLVMDGSTGPAFERDYASGKGFLQLPSPGANRQTVVPDDLRSSRLPTIAS
jgi:hypothetical protein